MAASTGIGMYFGSGIQDRLEKLRMLKQQFLMIRGDISYGNTSLPEVMEAMGEKEDTAEFGEFYREVSKRLRAREGVPFREIWEAAVWRNLNKTTLRRQDLELLSSVGAQFGYLDREMQLKTIDFFLARLEEEIMPEAQKAGEKMRLCKTLGLLAGAALVVVML